MTVYGFDDKGTQTDKVSGKIETVDQYKKQNGKVVKAFLNAYSTKTQTKGFRLLLRFQDDDIFLFHSLPSSSAFAFEWKREEALASVVKTETLDLPSSHVLDDYVSTLSKEVETPNGKIIILLKSKS
jgi:hypothetical protein